MPVEVVLPKVDMDMTHGTLAAWHVEPGGRVAKGAPLFDIETDKAAMEVEAPASGRLGAVTAGPGSRVPVGTVIALIYAEGEAAEAAEAAGPGPDAARPGPAAAPSPRDPVPGEGPSGGTTPSIAAGSASPGLRATPAARAEARRTGMDLARMEGTGPQRRIQRDDVARAARAEAAPPPGAAPARPAGRLHVSTRGGTGVPLVLLHGFAADSQGWAPLEKALGPDRALIRVDLPGHGRSPRWPVAGFAALARIVVEAFDEATRALGRVDVLGHSLGGALALALADVRPRRIRSLALIAPAGLGPEIDAPALAGIARATRPESLAPWLRRLTATPEGIGDDYVRAVMRQRADPALRAYQADLAEALFPDGVQAFDLRPALSRTGCPATLVWGRSDHVLPWRQAVAVAGDFALHLLPGAGHVPQIECPERVAGILARHLAPAPPTP